MKRSPIQRRTPLRRTAFQRNFPRVGISLGVRSRVAERSEGICEVCTIQQRNGRGGVHRKPRNLAHAREVMGIDWMTRVELSQAVPPAFTRFIGSQLISYLEAAT